MSDIPTKLNVEKGSRTEWEVHLFDEADTAEDLSSVTDATLTIRSSLAGTALATVSIGSGLTKNSGYFTVDPDSFIDDLPVGRLVCCLAVKVGTKWYYSESFYVDVDQSAGSTV